MVACAWPSVEMSEPDLPGLIVPLRPVASPGSGSARHPQVPSPGLSSAGVRPDLGIPASGDLQCVHSVGTGATCRGLGLSRMSHGPRVPYAPRSGRLLSSSVVIRDRTTCCMSRLDQDLPAATAFARSPLSPRWCAKQRQRESPDQLPARIQLARIPRDRRATRIWASSRCRPSSSAISGDSTEHSCNGADRRPENVHVDAGATGPRLPHRPARVPSVGSAPGPSRCDPREILVDGVPVSGNPGTERQRRQSADRREHRPPGSASARVGLNRKFERLRGRRNIENY